MEPVKRKAAIFKAINYIDSSMEKIEHNINYILDEKKTPHKYRKGWYLDIDDSLSGIERFYKRYHPKGTRNFKHYIISFGLSDLSVDKAFEVGQELAGYYGQDYPMILGIHTNIPARIHAHFLLNTVNVRTGKKFSESRKAFEQYRCFINATLLDHHMPGLSGLEENIDSNSQEITYEDTYMPLYEFYPIEYSMPNSVDGHSVIETVSKSLVDIKIDEKQVADAYFDGIKTFYNLGRTCNGK